MYLCDFWLLTSKNVLKPHDAPSHIVFEGFDVNWCFPAYEKICISNYCRNVVSIQKMPPCLRKQHVHGWQICFFATICLKNRNCFIGPRGKNFDVSIRRWVTAKREYCKTCLLKFPCIFNECDLAHFSGLGMKLNVSTTAWVSVHAPGFSSFPSYCMHW